MAYTGTSRVRALIVDDDEVYRRTLRSLLAPDEDVEIVGEAGSAFEARRWIMELQPDLVFMDIEMPGGGGELLQDLQAPLPYVIVVAAHPEFAQRAFDLQASDFLVKPVQRQRFADSVQRARRRITERRVAEYAMQIAGAAIALNDNRAIGAAAPFSPYPGQMTIRVRRRMYSIDVNDIAWIQGASQYSRLHTRSGEYLLSRTLASLECELDPRRFFRIHRSAIVNASYVREVRSRGDGCYNVYLHGGQALPMGRARREILHKLLGGIGSEENRIRDAPDEDSP
jgi:two-component system LytT family response regulator